MVRHALLDGVEMNRCRPAAFRIPSASEKARIRPGDYVKVGFVIDPVTGQQECVWLRVQAVNGDTIAGVLDDDPVYAEAAFGERIELDLRHVLAIER